MARQPSLSDFLNTQPLVRQEDSHEHIHFDKEVELEQHLHV